MGSLRRDSLRLKPAIVRGNLRALLKFFLREGSRLLLKLALRPMGMPSRTVYK